MIRVDWSYPGALGYDGGAFRLRMDGLSVGDVDLPNELPTEQIGINGAGDIMNMVVLTAAFSSLNAGLYSTGRILRSMSMNGSAPKLASRMSSGGVPYVGIGKFVALVSHHR